MGRDLSWYIIPRDIKHEDTKVLCMELEFEPESDEFGELLYDHVHGVEATSDEPKLKVWDIATYKNRRDKEQKLRYRYLYDDSYQHEWCPKCLMYANGLYGCPLVIAHEHVQHSYSNPIWMSDWNVKDLYMGSSTTPFIRRFSKDRLYREIVKDDVMRAYDEIERLGECFRTSDKEAKEETLMILEFLSRYVDDPNVRMILEDEY